MTLTLALHLLARRMTLARRGVIIALSLTPSTLSCYKVKGQSGPRVIGHMEAILRYYGGRTGSDTKYSQSYSTSKYNMPYNLTELMLKSFFMTDTTVVQSSRIVKSGIEDAVCSKIHVRHLLTGLLSC